MDRQSDRKASHLEIVAADGLFEAVEATEGESEEMTEEMTEEEWAEQVRAEAAETRANPRFTELFDELLEYHRAVDRREALRARLVAEETVNIGREQDWVTTTGEFHSKKNATRAARLAKQRVVDMEWLVGERARDLMYIDG